MSAFKFSILAFGKTPFTEHLRPFCENENLLSFHIRLIEFDFTISFFSNG